MGGPLTKRGNSKEYFNAKNKLGCCFLAAPSLTLMSYSSPISWSHSRFIGRYLSQRHAAAPAVSTPEVSFSLSSTLKTRAHLSEIISNVSFFLATSPIPAGMAGVFKLESPNPNHSTTDTVCLSLPPRMSSPGQNHVFLLVSSTVPEHHNKDGHSANTGCLQHPVSAAILFSGCLSMQQEQSQGTCLREHLPSGETPVYRWFPDMGYQ